MPDKLVTKQDIIDGLERLGLSKDSRVIVHSSLKSFGRVDGGPETVVRAVREVCGSVLMPTFSWEAIYYPEGWETNPNVPKGMTAERVAETNARAKPFTVDSPTSRAIGAIPEALRLMPDSINSKHPVHRYAAAGDDAENLISTQTVDSPLQPIIELRKLGGFILLLGVGHNRNTAIHLAEKEAGCRQWGYWALTADRGVVECRNHPGCSDAFGRVEPILEPITKHTMIGECRARLLPLAEAVERVKNMLIANPRALLCGNCVRCNMIDEELSF